MKKTSLLLILVLTLCVGLMACGDGKTENTTKESDSTKNEAVKEEQKDMTAEDYLNALKDAGCPIGEIMVFDESTDLNSLLGRPNQYTSKADFADTNLEQMEVIDYENYAYLNGGTIEVFETKADCDSRYDFLKEHDDQTLGILALNQYIYKGDTAILRVSYDVIPEQAAIYESAFNELVK